MRLPVRSVVCSVLALFVAPLCDGQFARFVDPLLGVSGGGNVFPGAVVPFGMIKPGPDMVAPEGQDANAGWNDAGDIRGFSQTHVSGTGGGAKYGNILVQATTGDIAPLDSASPRADEKASAGLYSVTLARYGVWVEIAAARRSAIYRIRYPQGTKANLLFDVSHYLLSGMRTGEMQSLVYSEIKMHFAHRSGAVPQALQADGTSSPMRTRFIFAPEPTHPRNRGERGLEANSSRPARAWRARPSTNRARG